MLSIGTGYIVFGKFLWVKIDMRTRLRERIAGWRRVKQCDGLHRSYDVSGKRHFTVDDGRVIIGNGWYSTNGEPPFHYRDDSLHPMRPVEWQANLTRNGG